MEEIITACKASQNKQELRWLLEQVEIIKPKVVVEIGSWRGWLLDTFFKALDPDIAIGIELDQNNLSSEIVDTMKDNFIIGDSNRDEILNQLKLRLHFKMIDFLFIDGNHSYSAVKRDLEMYGPLVREGGIIAFHDVSVVDNPTVDVYRLWTELEKEGRNVRKLTGKNVDGTSATGTGILFV